MSMFFSEDDFNNDLNEKERKQTIQYYLDRYNRGDVPFIESEQKFRKQKEKKIKYYIEKYKRNKDKKK